MKSSYSYPSVCQVTINDSFWTPYITGIREIMLPYVFEKLEGDGYLENFESVARGETGFHKGPPFSDGLLLESLRGACDFLAQKYDPQLDKLISRIVGVIKAASEISEDGFICTKTLEIEPEHRWGENGGDIVIQHDLYDHGALIEAAVSHYNATKSTELLDCAVRIANTICSYMGEPPKHNIIPGHSLPEEAFVRLYRLFKENRSLDEYAKSMKVNADDYLEMANFWYKARGDHNGRCVSRDFSHEYNQDNITFEDARTAVGHAVRAALCYTGAADVSLAYGDMRYTKALNALWRNVVDKKMHISGGIGTRHDIEGFDSDYALPNNAYLETCAAVALAFWAAEMNLIEPKSEYFDVFERSLYNNILASVDQDFMHYFYQNPLVSEGGVKRWAWHGCPCCPPMLLKLYSTLNKYIYSLSDNELCINMLIESHLEADALTAELSNGKLRLSSKSPITLRIRIPEYAESFELYEGGRSISFELEAGYAVIRDISSAVIEIKCTERLIRAYANPLAAEDIGKVAVMNGKFLMCAEGIDNSGRTDFTIASDAKLERDGENVIGMCSDGSSFKLIPYYKWCRRTTGRPEDDRMSVWFKQASMPSKEKLSAAINEKLYGNFEELI